MTCMLYSSSNSSRQEAHVIYKTRVLYRYKIVWIPICLHRATYKLSYNLRLIVVSRMTYLLLERTLARYVIDLVFSVLV